MSKYALLVTDAVIKFGPTATAVEFQCQVTSAAVTVTPNLITVPATGCEGQTQQPAASTYALALSFLQDWGQTDSLSQYLWDNDTMQADFSVALASDPLVPVASGTVRVVAGQYGGDFANPLNATVTLPCQAKPTIGPAAGTLAAPAPELADA